MSYVVDASSVAAYLLGEGAPAERKAMVVGDGHAPGLVDVEVTETLRGLLRGAKIDLDTAQTGRAELAELAVRRHPEGPLLRRAWELRDVCTVYDALYLALAEALDATLITRDARFGRSASRLVKVIVTA